MPFYHTPTNSWSYFLADPARQVCAFIDPVLDFEPGAGAVQHDFITQMLKTLFLSPWMMARSDSLSETSLRRKKNLRFRLVLSATKRWSGYDARLAVTRYRLLSD